MDPRGYISLDVSSSSYQDSPVRSNNIWRKWNKLSRLQKSTLYLLVTILVFIFIYTHQQEKRGHHITESQGKKLADQYHEAVGGGHQWPPKFKENMQDEPAVVDTNGRLNLKKTCRM